MKEYSSRFPRMFWMNPTLKAIESTSLAAKPIPLIRVKIYYGHQELGNFRPFYQLYKKSCQLDEERISSSTWGSTRRGNSFLVDLRSTGKEFPLTFFLLFWFHGKKRTILPKMLNFNFFQHILYSILKLVVAFAARITWPLPAFNVIVVVLRHK